MIGWLVFMATIKFLKLLRFNRRMSVLAGTLKNGAKPLASYMIVFSATFFAYVVVFWGIFGSVVLNYSTLIYTAETLLSMTLGKFDFYILQRTRPDIGPFLFFLYICSITFILLNMFVSILNESFSSVQQNLVLQSNDHEILDFMIYKLRVLIGKESSNKYMLTNHASERKQEEEMTKHNMQISHMYGFGGNYALDSGADRISKFLNKLTLMHMGKTPFPFEQFKIKWDDNHQGRGQGQGHSVFPQKYGHHLNVVDFE